MNPLHTVTLDATAETLLREHGVMVVDGERVVTHDRPDGSTCCYMPLKAGHGQWLCTKCGQGGATIHPSWTVVASEPCVTCHGTGWYTNASDAIQEIFGSEIDCPDCHDGRPVLSFIVGDATSFWVVERISDNDDGTFTLHVQEVE